LRQVNRSRRPFRHPVLSDRWNLDAGRSGPRVEVQTFGDGFAAINDGDRADSHGGGTVAAESQQGLRVGTPGEWMPLYQDIEGYTHEPGVRNVLRLKRFTIKNPPVDAPATAYVLDTVIESEVVKPAQ